MNNHSQIDLLLEPKETSKILGKSTSWLAKSRLTGDGPPYVKVGRSVRYLKSGLETWLQSRAYSNTAQYR